MENGYTVYTEVKGKVIAIKPYNDKSSKKGAQLQFMNVGEKGLTTIDVKIEGSREEDLLKFVNQNVVVKNISISKVEFSTFYSCPDKSLISIHNKK